MREDYSTKDLFSEQKFIPFETKASPITNCGLTWQIKLMTKVQVKLTCSTFNVILIVSDVLPHLLSITRLQKRSDRSRYKKPKSTKQLNSHIF